MISMGAAPMNEFVFHPAGVPSVAVAGSDARFPIRRVFCVGRNYAAHAEFSFAIGPRPA